MPLAKEKAPERPFRPNEETFAEYLRNSFASKDMNKENIPMI